MAKGEASTTESPAEAAPPLPATEPPSESTSTPSTADAPPLPQEVQPVVHKGKGDWQAVWSPEANAYYFWNSKTQEVTWTNPLASASEQKPTKGKSTEEDQYGGIDPELAFLDPTLAARSSDPSSSNGAGPAFTARFNARTGRFTAEGHYLTPDRISDFNRAERQQQAFYDTEGWQASLQGRGSKRAGEEDEGKRRKKPNREQVEEFKRKKLEKKKKRLMDDLLKD